MSAKEEVLELVKKLPDNASLEDIQYHLYIRQKVEKGLREAEAGKTLSQEEIERRLEKWLVR
ncbi:MAG: hypothetical protein ACRD3M_04870 [Thermoanaerobaculia bacterium]